MRLLFSLLFGTLTFFSCTLFAGNVDESLARQVAVNWYRHYAPQSKKQAVITKTIPYKFNGRECFRIYSFDKGGFVLVSANDAVTPVLGYGFDHTVPDSITNEAVKSWFDCYARLIDSTRMKSVIDSSIIHRWNELRSNRFTKSMNGTAGPLITTTWNQGWPYNQLCPAHPEGPGGHTWAGCVAIAMAQILKYHSWPPVGYDSLYYSYIGVGPGGTPIPGYAGANFGGTTYNWQNMPSSLSDTNSDLATLIFHAGISVQSLYGTESTGAYSGAAVDGYVKCFRYAYSGIKYYLNMIEGFSPSQWDSILHLELDSFRPVLYRGEILTSSGGHAFVCDGYDSTGFYHFNFGWGGSMDGYFPLSNISPLNFSWAQGMVVGIKPNDGSTITEDQTWSGAKHLNTKTIVLDHATLTLLPGTTVTSDFGASLRISGTIHANGTAGDSVVFTASDQQLRWDGLSIEKGNWSESDSSNLNYTVVKSSRFGGLQLNGIEHFNMTNSSIRDNKMYPYIAGNGSYWCSTNNGIYNITCVGGGIFSIASDGKIKNSRITRNWTWSNGGGIAAYGPNNMLVIENCLIDHNEARLNGGGCCVNAGVKTRISGNEFTANNAIEGGAIAIYNIAVDSIRQAPLIFANKIHHNAGAFSAGIFSQNSDALIVNNVITENNCYGMGDNVMTLSGQGPGTKVWLMNNTIAGNSGCNSHIGIAGDVTFSPRFYNTILAGKIGQECEGAGPLIRLGTPGMMPVFSHCYISRDSLSFTGSPGPSFFSDTSRYRHNLSWIDARLQVTAGWNPAFNSPCIDEGKSSDYPVWLNQTDVAGNSRTNRIIDIGAFEDTSDTLFPCITSLCPLVDRCQGDSFSYTIQHHGDSLRFQWYLDQSLLPADTTETYSREALLPKDSGRVSCRVWNSMGSDSASFLLTVYGQPPPLVSFITGDTLLHHFQCSSVSGYPVAGASNYVWESSAGLDISSYADSNRKVSFTVKPTAGSEYLRVKACNPCGTSHDWQTIAITCDSIPGIIGGYSYINPVLCVGSVQMILYDLGFCLEQQLDLEWELPTGCERQWWNNRGIGFTAAPGAQSGMIRVRWNKTGYGIGDWREDFLDIQSPITESPGIVNGPDTVFLNQEGISYSIEPVAGASGYTWEIPAGVTVTSGLHAPVITLQTFQNEISGNIRTQAYNTCGNSDFSGPLYVESIPVQANQIVQGIVENNESQCYEAGLVLTTGGSGQLFTIEPDGLVSLVAGEKILLLDGTTVLYGGFLKAYIAPSGPWCSQAPIPSRLTPETGPVVSPYSQEIPPHVFPNPTCGSFKISLPPGSMASVRIICMNLMGTEVFSKVINEPSDFSETLEDQYPGIYILKISQGDDNWTLKLIKL